MTIRVLTENTLECGHTLSDICDHNSGFVFETWFSRTDLHCQECDEPKMLKKVTMSVLAKNIKEIRELEQ